MPTSHIDASQISKFFPLQKLKYQKQIMLESSKSMVIEKLYIYIEYYNIVLLTII